MGPCAPARAGSCVCAACVRACARGMGRRAAFRGRRWRGWRRKRGLVSAGAPRGIRAVVQSEPQLRGQGQRIEHQGDNRRRQQLLQHDCGQQERDRHEREVCEPGRARSCDRDDSKGLHIRSACRQKHRARRSAGSRESASASIHSRQCASQAGSAWNRSGIGKAAGHSRKTRRRRQGCASSAASVV